jgi:hypothetical protein
MTPEYLCSSKVTDKDKAIACKSAFHALHRPLEWSELVGHLEYLRHANLRWGSCDPSDSRIHAFLKDADTRTLASTFASHAIAAPLLPYPKIVPTDATELGDPYPLGAVLHKRLASLQQCCKDLAQVDEMSIDSFSKTLWKDTIRSNCSFLETLEAVSEDIKTIAKRCSKVLSYVQVLYKEAQRYAACEDSDDSRSLVEWSKRLCGLMDGIASFSIEPCTSLEVDSYMTTVIGFHNSLSELYVPIPMKSCPVNSPLEIPCTFMMRQYSIVMDLLTSI